MPRRGWHQPRPAGPPYQVSRFSLSRGFPHAVSPALRPPVAIPLPPTQTGDDHRHVHRAQPPPPSPPPRPPPVAPPPPPTQTGDDHGHVNRAQLALLDLCHALGHRLSAS